MEKQHEMPGSDARININDQALAYLKEKYGETFTYAGAWGNSLSGNHGLLASCESLPERTICVVVKNYRTAEKSFADNLLAVRFEEETLRFLQECSQTVYGEAAVFYSAASECFSLPPDTGFPDFLRLSGVPLVVTVEIPAEQMTSEGQAEELARRIAESGALFYVTVAAVENSLYGTLELRTLQDRIGMREIDYCVEINNLSGSLQSVWFGKELEE